MYFHVHVHVLTYRQYTHSLHANRWPNYPLHTCTNPSRLKLLWHHKSLSIIVIVQTFKHLYSHTVHKITYCTLFQIANIYYVCTHVCGSPVVESCDHSPMLWYSWNVWGLQLACLMWPIYGMCLFLPALLRLPCLALAQAGGVCLAMGRFVAWLTGCLCVCICTCMWGREGGIERERGGGGGGGGGRGWGGKLEQGIMMCIPFDLVMKTFAYFSAYMFMSH